MTITSLQVAPSIGNETRMSRIAIGEISRGELHYMYQFYRVIRMLSHVANSGGLSTYYICVESALNQPNGRLRHVCTIACASDSSNSIQPAIGDNTVTCAVSCSE